MYLRPPVLDKIEELIDENFRLRDIHLDNDLDHENSWFSLLWTCIKKRNLSFHIDSTDINSGINSIPSFLIFYRFKPNNETDLETHYFCNYINLTCLERTPSQVEVIGMIPQN